jgi:hypothetical protein
MSAARSGSTVMGRALGCHEDGLFDIFLGFVLLDGWTIVRGGASSGGAIIVLLPLLLVAKRAITVPRLPVESKEPSGIRPIRGRGAVLAVVLAALTIGALAVVASGARGPRPWELVALAGLGALAAGGLRLGARRFALYAGLALVAFVCRSAPATAYLAPALAAGMAAWGGVLLVRFRAGRPRVA